MNPDPPISRAGDTARLDGPAAPDGRRASPGAPMRAFVAIAATGAALALFFVFEAALVERPFALFFAAVFVAAWHGGLWPGLLCTALGFVALHLFILEPRGLIAFLDRGDLVQSLTFLGVGGMASVLAGQLHQARARALAAAEENALLVMRLQEQAVELETQAEEAQVLTAELEDQVDEAARLRGEVQHANDRLVSILDTLPEGVVLAAPDGAVTFANPAARRLLERLPGDRGPLRYDGRALDLSLETPLSRVLRGGDAEAQAEVPVEANGIPAVLRVTAAPLRDGNAAVRGVVASFQDVTAEREAQNAVRESEARFRTLADTAPVLIWMAGTDGLCNFFNRAWLEFTGRTMEQEAGNGWAAGVHPDDYERCLDVYLTNFHARRPFVMEYRLRRADGEYRWLLDHGVPRFDPQGGFTGFIGSCIDITERRENEEGLRFLAEAGAVLASSLDYEETLRRLCRLAVPTIADFCVVDLLEDGVIRRVEAAHADPAMADVVAAALRHPPTMDHPVHPVPVALRTGRTQLLNGIVPEMTDGTAEHRGLRGPAGDDGVPGGAAARGSAGAGRPVAARHHLRPALRRGGRAPRGGAGHARGLRHRECAPVRPHGGGEPGQERLPGRDVARAADAAERHPGIHGPVPDGHPGAAAGVDGAAGGARAVRRAAPARPDRGGALVRAAGGRARGGAGGGRGRGGARRGRWPRSGSRWRWSADSPFAWSCRTGPSRRGRTRARRGRCC